MKPIKSQVIVITGASSGIGLATAKMAVNQGARVILSSRNTLDLEQIVKSLRAHGGEAVAFTADVTQLSDLEKLRDCAIQKYGRIDTWINNAGIAIYGKLMDVSLEEEKLVFETNFWGIRNGSRIAIPMLAESQGVLINIGSDVCSRAIPLQGIYSASKHAVKAFTEALRMEVERDQIPVKICLVRPAGVDTPSTEHALNRLEVGEPSISDPVYHPNVVAEAILACAQNPKRDVFIGGSSKIYQLMDVLAPRIADFLVEQDGFDSQTRGSRTPHTVANEGLIHPPAHEGKITGGHKGQVLKTSFSAQSESVIPLLSQGMKHLAKIGSAFAKNKVQPFVKDWKDARI
jgi:short-subunit dehydrogenase